MLAVGGTSYLAGGYGFHGADFVVAVGAICYVCAGGQETGEQEEEQGACFHEAGEERGIVSSSSLPLVVGMMNSPYLARVQAV